MPGVLPFLAITLLTVIAGGCAPAGSKGTLPPPGPDGQVDAASVPDFVEVATEDGTLGYVAKEYLLPSSSALPGLPRGERWPVVADDLRTVIGHMVQGQGFVPLGGEHGTHDTDPVAGPSGSPAESDGSLVVYVRHPLSSNVWLTLRAGGNLAALPIGFPAGVGVACLPYVEGAALRASDEEPGGGGARSWPVTTLPAPTGEPIVWIDVTPEGELSHGAGVPEWWTDPPQTC